MPIRFDSRTLTDVPPAARSTVVRTLWSGTELDSVGTACHTGSQRITSERTGTPEAPQASSNASAMITLTGEVCG